jgi:hypothetical protein
MIREGWWDHDLKESLDLLEWEIFRAFPYIDSGFQDGRIVIGGWGFYHREHRVVTYILNWREFLRNEDVA